MTNPGVDAYLERITVWREETSALREILLGCGLAEELKWGKPCYVHEGANIVLIQGFKDYCALLFFKGALMKDPDGLLVRLTENTQAARQIRFTDVAGVRKRKTAVKAYVREAVGVEKAGLEVEYRKTEDFEVPDELREKWKASPAFKKAFDALTPGRQRGYLLHFVSPKQPKTREARIEKCMDRIFEGKGVNER